MLFREDSASKESARMQQETDEASKVLGLVRQVAESLGLQTGRDLRHFFLQCVTKAGSLFDIVKLMSSGFSQVRSVIPKTAIPPCLLG
jgi:hypothetical protein